MLAILTINVAALSFNFLGIPIFQPIPYPEQRLEKIVENVIRLNPDIITFQEVFSQEDKEYLIEQLKEDYPYHAFAGSQEFPRSGLITFSKSEIVNKEFTPFDSVSYLERSFLDKGFLIVTLKDKIKLVNTHTTAGGLFSRPESKHIEKIRRNQIEQLIKAVREDENDISYLLTGDFNTGPRVSVDNYNQMIENDFHDSFAVDEEAKGKDPVQFTWDSNNIFNRLGFFRSSPSQRVDHIFIDKKDYLKKYELVDARIVLDDIWFTPDKTKKKIPLSDHYGLFVKLNQIKN